MLLQGYQIGVFPMAEDRDSEVVQWFAPDPRAILPLDGFHVPKTLAKLVRQNKFEVVSDRNFEGVMRACAARETTWISDDIIRSYVALYENGYAHSVECWLDGRLVGGLYGVAIGGAFFGESMFHHERDASKVALVHLVRCLNACNYTLLDTQFTTPHLEKFGVIEIPRIEYEEKLDRALEQEVKPWAL
ncbi:MAG: leucyl/phenylalanyl-tRNA--protein transferase [Bacteroidota bacterium]